MFDSLIQILFGWPAMILSLALALAGLILRKPSLLAVSAILFVLPAWYLSHYSIAFGSLPLFLVASAYSISNHKNFRAFLLFLPVLIATSLLGYIVLTQ